MSTVTAIVGFVRTQPYAGIGRWQDVSIQELWIPPPYGICVNVADGGLNIFPRQKTRLSHQGRTLMEVDKVWADDLLAHVEKKLAIQSKVREILGIPPPRPPSPTPRYLSQGRRLARQYVKEHKDELRVGQELLVLEGTSEVHVFPNFQAASLFAGGRVYYCTSIGYPGIRLEDTDSEEDDFSLE